MRELTPEYGGMTTQVSTGRANQKQRTRTAIVAATRDLTKRGAEIGMPAVARAALVSEATAYRYFPDLVSLLREANDEVWPSPAESLAPIADVTDPVERVGYAAEVLLRGVLAYQGAVRAMISASITRPGSRRRPARVPVRADRSRARPGGGAARPADPETLAQLKRDLAVVMSAEALFTLTDLCGLPPEEAITSAVRTARALTAAGAGTGAGTRAATGASPGADPPARH